jgi:hypothetical protein
MAPASLFNKDVGLTLSGGFYLESANELFQFFPATFWAFRLPIIVLSETEHGSKFLFTFRASIVIAWHPLPLLSLSNYSKFHRKVTDY